GSGGGASIASLHGMLNALAIHGSGDRMVPGIGPRDVPIEIEPEVILPAQFADLTDNVAARPPEHRLMFAVLEDAVHVYLAGHESGNRPGPAALGGGRTMARLGQCELAVFLRRHLPGAGPRCRLRPSGPSRLADASGKGA